MHVSGGEEMRKYETIPHTADVGLKVEADSMPELFLGALVGMGGIMRNDVCAPGMDLDARRKVEVSSLDESSLLIDFLSEVLAASSEEYAIFCDADFSSVSADHVVAEIRGLRVDGFEREIKAVTYHGSKIVRNEAGNLETVVLFDI